MIRFVNGVPDAIWYSQHSDGEAFSYTATEKNGQRPIAYSGNGTHAVYAISGYVKALVSPPHPSPKGMGALTL